MTLSTAEQIGHLSIRIAFLPFIRHLDCIFLCQTFKGTYFLNLNKKITVEMISGELASLLMG